MWPPSIYNHFFQFSLLAVVAIIATNVLAEETPKDSSSLRPKRAFPAAHYHIPHYSDYPYFHPALHYPEYFGHTPVLTAAASDTTRTTIPAVAAPETAPAHVPVNVQPPVPEPAPVPSYPSTYFDHLEDHFHVSAAHPVFSYHPEHFFADHSYGYEHPPHHTVALEDPLTRTAALLDDSLYRPYPHHHHRERR